MAVSSAVQLSHTVKQFYVVLIIAVLDLYQFDSLVLLSAQLFIASQHHSFLYCICVFHI